MPLESKLPPHLQSRITQLTTPRIKNPLVGIPKHQLIQDVEEFAAQHELQDIKDLLIKGALVAQNPTRIDSISELDESDRTVIIEEVTHKWRQPRTLYMTIFLNSIAAAIQGWDQTGRHSSVRVAAHANLLRVQRCKHLVPSGFGDS